MPRNQFKILAEKYEQVKFNPKELKAGTKEELKDKHTKNRKQAEKIAKDHLSQDPHYYTKLKKAGIDEQLNEIGFAPGMSPREDKNVLANIKQSIWVVINDAADENEKLALPNGMYVDIHEIRKKLIKASTLKEVEKVFFDYGLDYFIHENPE